MKSSKYLFLAILLSILPIITIFLTPDLPHTHDGAVHLPRMAAYIKALADGQILPRWAGDLNYGYGLPLFNFIYHTPYLIGALFIKLGLSLILSFKLLLLINYVLAGIFMFMFANKLFNDGKKAFVVTIFYQFAPFRLVEVLIRGSLGEIYVYAFTPLVLYGLLLIFENPTAGNIALTAIATIFLIISHNSMSLVFFGACSLFLLLFAKSIKKIIQGSIALSLGLLGSLFYWLPALLEHKYTLGDLYMKDLFREHFPPIYQFFLPNFFNSKSLTTGGVPIQIGISHILVLVLTIYILFFRKKISFSLKKLFKYTLILVLFAFFFMSRSSIFIWEKIGFLRQFQFPWRLLSLLAFATALMSCSLFEFKWYKKIIVYWLIIFFVIFSTAYYWNPVLGYNKINSEKIFWDYPLDTTYFGETDVVWSAGPAKKYPPAPVLVAEGNAEITEYTKKSNLHTYKVVSKTDVTIVDNTQYFPGWRVYIDGQKTTIEFQNQNWRDLITYKVSKGEHVIKVAFEKSPIQFFSEIVSWVTLISIMALLLVNKVKKIL